MMLEGLRELRAIHKLAIEDLKIEWRSIVAVIILFQKIRQRARRDAKRA